MGCCASINKTSPPPKPPHFSDSCYSKSPPPTYPLIEAETVKEVLSETPTITKFHESHQNEIQFIRTVDFSRKVDERKHHRNGAVLRKPFSESPWVSTTITKKKENSAGFNDLRRRSQARFGTPSFSGEAKREKTAGKIPGRRSEPSRGQNRPGPATRRTMESSCRRPRPPATRTEAGPGSSTRKTGCAGSRSGGRVRKMDGGKQPGENTWPTNSNDLLENPLVSLECFIFL